MTMSPREIERKVKQLDIDVQAIYVMLADIQATQKRHENRFDTIDGRLDGIDGRLDGIDGRLDGMTGQLTMLTESMTEVLRRLPG